MASAKKRPRQEEDGKIHRACDDAPIEEAIIINDTLPVPLTVDACCSNDAAPVPLTVHSCFKELLAPLTVDDFLKHYYHKKRPVVIRGSNESKDNGTTKKQMKNSKELHQEEERFSRIIEAMNDLDIQSLLDDTPSECISVWTLTKNGQIDSARVDDARSAFTLYNAGHSLYCRAPEKIENIFVKSAIKCLGLGFGDDGGTGAIKPVIDGEVELFLSHKGHKTASHFDFQENWTLQLKGKKKWLLQSGMVNPVRGCTPHYHQREGILDPAAEEQLKVHRSRDPSFRYGPTQPPKEVVLGPGDFFYHPAGLYHAVECLEDSISINISLDGTSYADLISNGLRQVLLANEKYAAMVQTKDIKATEECLRSMLEEVSAHLFSQLTPSALIPPALMWGNEDKTNDIDKEEEDDEEEEEEGEEEEEVEEGCDDDSLEAAAWSVPVLATSILRRNPLASFFAIADASHHIDDDPEDAYMIHVGFGSEDLTSYIRKKIMIPKEMHSLSSFIAKKKVKEIFSVKDVPGGDTAIGRNILGALVHYGVILQ